LESRRVIRHACREGNSKTFQCIQYCYKFTVDCIPLLRRDPLEIVRHGAEVSAVDDKCWTLRRTLWDSYRVEECALGLPIFVHCRLECGHYALRVVPAMLACELDGFTPSRSCSNLLSSLELIRCDLELLERELNLLGCIDCGTADHDSGEVVKELKESFATVFGLGNESDSPAESMGDATTSV